jgi:iron only hydrogenase large subunit-like protein/uncharacterized Fe-S cluster-containing protein
MREIIRLNESDCKNCYKCLRQCPTKSISFKSGRANIIWDECILCGTCFVTCPQSVKNIQNDVDYVKELLKGDAPVFASIAPSFTANYDGLPIGSVREALLTLGFAGVEETAIGATIVKNRYDEMLDEGQQNIIISSCCHSINTFIQKKYPAALPYLAKVVSPMIAHCTQIKSRNPGVKTVFIGPCISKKAEAEVYPGLVDCVLTFEELSQWLKEVGIVMREPTEEDVKGKATFFPVAGGILKSMRKDNPDYEYIAIDGMESSIEVLEEICHEKFPEKCFIEMSACKGSCINGPVMEKEAVLIRGFIHVANQAAEHDFIVEMPEREALAKSIRFSGSNTVRPGGDAIKSALQQMSKFKPEDELNCGSCGYNTCREKAAAIVEGKADISMCLPYLMERVTSFSDLIINNSPNGVLLLSETLEIQQINAAACEITRVKQPQDILGQHISCILDPIQFLTVVKTHQNIYEERIYLAEYDRYVMLTVIFDNIYNVVIGLMRDVTVIEKNRVEQNERNRKTMEVTDKVIERQMRIVQEIASLLGETTAETKVAFTKLKETLRNE